MGEIGATKTVAITSCFDKQGMIGVCLGLLVLPEVPSLIVRVEVFPLFCGAGESSEEITTLV